MRQVLVHEWHNRIVRQKLRDQESSRELADWIMRLREEPMKKPGPSNLHIALVLTAIVVFAFLMTWLAASMESRTYNRLTGAQTTTWDAMWVELRVQGDPG